MAAMTIRLRRAYIVLLGFSWEVKANQRKISSKVFGLTRSSSDGVAI